MKVQYLNIKTLFACGSLVLSAPAAFATANTTTTTTTEQATATATPTPTPATQAQATPATPATPLSKEDIVLLVNEAVKFAKEKGNEEAFKEFNKTDGQFTKPNTYIFAIDFKGDVLAHGNNAELVGKNHYDAKDTKGRSIVRALIEKSRYGNGAWVTYVWKNPATQADECKSSYVTTVDKKIVIGAGYHHAADKNGNCVTG